MLHVTSGATSSFSCYDFWSFLKLMKTYFLDMIFFDTL